MATDPSSNFADKRSHARKNTPVLPALPLSLLKKTKRLHTPTPSHDAQIRSATSASDQTKAKTEDPAEAGKPEPDQVRDVVNPAEAQHSNQPIEKEIDQVGKVEVVNESASQETSIGSEQIPLVQPQEAFEQETLHNEAGPSPEIQLPESSQTPQSQPLSEGTFEPQTTSDGTNGNEVLDASSNEKVHLVEDETQPSELEISSAEPSSTTGLTDYGSATGESTLETVVDNVDYGRKAMSLSHRTSEVAPEALTNGHLPQSPHDSNTLLQANGSLPTPAPKPTVLPNIQEHLLFLASSKQFFDTIIYVNHPDQSYHPSEHFGHYLFLSRSNDLAKLMSEPEPTGQPQAIQLYPARNILPHAFEAALRFFYSDHVLAAQAVLPQVGYQNKQAKEQTFEYVMSYWFAGIELGLQPVKTRSYEMVQELVDWDLADMVAKELQILRAAEATMSNKSVKTEVQAVADSLAQLLTRLFVGQLNISGFTLDPSAQSWPLRSRFAQLEFPRSSNPALSGMVFGSLPSEPLPQATSQSNISAILLNLNSKDFKHIADEIIVLHGSRGVGLIREVVQHREDKRQQVVSNRAVPNKQRVANSPAWSAAGWREYVDEAGYVTQERVGVLLPSKSR